MVELVKLKMPFLVLKNVIAVKQDDLAIQVPFGKVRKLRLTIEFPKDMQATQTVRNAARLQYELLQLEPVLRASVTGGSAASPGEALIVYDGKKTTAANIVDFTREKLQKIASNASVRLVEDVEFDYAKLVEEGYHSQ